MPMPSQAQALSIVIPVYNEEDHLDGCLRAIAKQTVMPEEVIVVDNNCTDGSMAIAKRYPFVRVVRAKHQGIAYARNAGFDAVKTEIIGRIDADTHLPPTWVATVMNFYKQPEHTNMAITGGCTFYNIPLPNLGQWITSQFVFRMNRLLVGHYILWGSNMALPKKLWQAVKPDVCMDRDIHEDLDLAIHLHSKGYQINYQATLVVGAKMKRVLEDHQALWPVLKMWPETLKRHHIKTWRIGWLGAAFLYIAQFVPQMGTWLSKRYGNMRTNQ